MGYEIKDAPNSAPQDSPHPEVVAEVLRQVKALGDNTKALYEEQARKVAEMKAFLDAADGKTSAVIEERFKKFAEDVTVRQEELDKKIAARIDQIEVALKRVPRSTGGGGQTEMDEAKQFFVAQRALSRKEIPAGGLPDDQVNLDEFQAYRRAFPAYLRRFDERAQRLTADQVKALSVGIDPDGGYLVTPAMSNRIITKLWENDPIRQLVAVETISTDALEMMVDVDEAACGWVGETESPTETATPQWKEQRIPVHEMYAEPRATQKLLEDSAIDVEAWLANKLGDKFGRVEGAAFVSGTGVKTPRGFLTYTNGTAWGQIEQVAMLHASAITTDGLINVKYSLIEQYLNRCTWLMNRLTVRDILKLKDGDGQYIWREGLTDAQPSMLLGLPLRMATSMPQVAANALSVALADWREAYTTVDRLGITTMRDPYTAKPWIKFYTRKRVGGAVTNFQAIKIGKVAAA
ncbi:MAG: phage major capsid protein [Desulforudis sp.]|jgi:HK97 family phage major capsid protein|nr:MAG: phage major capsid protein [Desulforudis sp.]